MGVEGLRLVSANAKTGRVKISVVKYVVVLSTVLAFDFFSKKYGGLLQDNLLGSVMGS